MAIDAGGDVGVAGGQAFSVDAGLVEFELIDAFAGGELAHVVRTAVAAWRRISGCRRAWACP